MLHFPPQWGFQAAQNSILSCPYYPYNKLVMSVKVKVYDWSKVTEQISMTEWKFRCGTPRSYCDTLQPHAGSPRLIF